MLGSHPLQPLAATGDLRGLGDERRDDVGWPGLDVHLDAACVTEQIGVGVDDDRP